MAGPKNAISSTVVQRVTTRDARYTLEDGAGSDAIHSDPQYSYAVTQLHGDHGNTGVGLAFTLGSGNELVCQAIALLSGALVGQEIEEVMSSFGETFHAMAEQPQLRWLGPHKGVVHLALASITNACFDLWAKSRNLPLWRLLLDLKPAEVLALLDLTYLEDVLTGPEVLAMLAESALTRSLREGVLTTGYPGYDTSVGWFGYGDERIRENVRAALDQGFRAFKLQVGAPDSDFDIRRATKLRAMVGEDAYVMVDANQQWSVPKAIRVCRELASISPYWVEEPTHPDDLLGHQTLAREISPILLAAGEHLANRVVFKNYLQAKCLGFVQVDCTRVGGVSEFLTVSLLSRKFGTPVVPHVGDMGQIHQHLVLFNHVGLGHPLLFLEYIPHLRPHFVWPARVENGVYQVPQEAGCSSDLKP